jgi:hypothetical protein
MKKNTAYEGYLQSVHRTGRLWVLLALAVLLSVPTAICVHFGFWPDWREFLQGFLGVAPIFWTVALIEVFTYVPMLGAGGSYLGFVTGNMTSLKVPCALNAMSAAKVKPGDEAGELISTIAIASSSIVTTLVIALGVFGLTFVQPVLEAPAHAPAFKQIIPALFGALSVVLIFRSWKIAVAPILVMLGLFIALPSLVSTVGVLVPVGILVTLLGARILYKKGWI